MIPSLICWSIPTGSWHYLFFAKITIITMLFIYTIWRVVNRTVHIERLTIESLGNSAFLNDLLESLESPNDSCLKVDDQLETSKTTLFQLSARSRTTPFCLFLMLYSDIAMRKRKTYSAIIFKWQISEDDYRAVTAEIARVAT